MNGDRLVSSSKTVSLPGKRKLLLDLGGEEMLRSSRGTGAGDPGADFLPVDNSEPVSS